jgi:hypothetical protein
MSKSQNYRVVHSGVGPWVKGDVISTKHIDANPALSGVDRLTRIGGIEPTDDDVTVDDPTGHPPASHTKGDNVEPGSDDTVEKRADRRKDAVGEGNTGMPADPRVALEEAKVSDLRKQAQAAGIDGAAKMSKDDLVEALAAKQPGGTSAT